MSGSALANLIARPAEQPESQRSAFSKRPQTRRALNVPLLIVTVVILAAATVAGYLLQKAQNDHSADLFLQRAAELKAEGKYGRAAHYLDKYLRLRPSDVDVHVELAELTDLANPDDSVNWGHQMQAINRALSYQPDNVKLLRRRAQLFQVVGRSEAALDAAKKLLDGEDKTPGNAQDLVALRIRAGVLQRQFAVGNQVPVEQVVAAHEAVLAVEPTDLTSAMDLARLYRTQERINGADGKPLPEVRRQRRADDIVQALLDRDGKRADVWLAAFDYRRRFRLPGADLALDKALALAPDDVSVIAQAAEASFLGFGIKRDLERAKTLYEKVTAIAPEQEGGYLGQALVHKALGDIPAMASALRRGIDRTPKENLKLELNSLYAGALIHQGKLDEAEQVIRALDKTLGDATSRLTGKQRTALANTVDFQRARWHLAKGTPQQAIPLFRQVLATHSAGEQRFLNAMEPLECRLALASIYALMEQWDQAAAEATDATTHYPTSLPTQLMAATYWLEAARPDRAVTHYERALKLPDVNNVVWALLARAQFHQQMVRPKEERTWESFQQSLAKTRQLLGDASVVTTLEADFFASLETAEGKVKAYEALRRGEAREAKSFDYWRHLVLAYQKLGRPDEADRALAQAEKLDDKSKSPRFYLLQAELFSQRGEPAKSVAVLQDALSRLPAAQQSFVKYRLVHYIAVLGRPDDARKQLEALYEANPKSLRLLRQLAELALEERDYVAAVKWEERTRQTEGDDGTYWRYFRARRLLAEAASAKDPKVAEAERLVEAIHKARPQWAATILLRGLLAERQGRVPQAIEAFEALVELGDSRPATYERLVGLLYQEGRFFEAQQFLTRMGQSKTPSEKLESLAIFVAAQQDQRGAALKLAQDAVQRRPKEVMPRIWLANMLWLSEKKPEAEAAFQDATKLAPQDARPWTALFSFYVRAGKKAEAETTLKDLSKNSKLSESQREFVLGQGYEMLGNLKEAEAHYQQAAKSAPTSIPIHLRWAGLLIQTDIVQADTVLRRVLTLDEKSNAARRALATTLAIRGGDANWSEAQQLLSKSGSEGSTIDDRLLAILLIQQGGDKAQRDENSLRARTILERLVQNPQQATPTDRLLLAGIYEREGKLDAAKAEFQQLVNRANPNASHLALFSDFLLRHEMLDEAAGRLSELEQLAGDKLSTVALRTKWLKKKQRDKDIPPLVDRHVQSRLAPLKKDEEKAKVYLDAGNLYVSVQMYAQAESWYRQLKAIVPRGYEPLAKALTAQGKLAEATAVCLEAAKTDDSAGPAIVLATVLANAKPTAEDFNRAEPLIDAALKKHKDNVEVLLAVGLIRTLQERGDEAIALYREVVRIAPKNLLALNNLATLLGEQTNGRNDALRYIDQAISVVGRKPDLLDTQATILLLDGNAQDAAKSLEEALEEALTSATTPDPRFYFHLALAYQQLRRQADAREALRKARAGGLESRVLTLTDKRLLAELDQKLSVEPPKPE